MIETATRGFVTTNHGAPSPDEQYLEHHGVKGQKWGVRKEPESTGSHGKRRMLTAIKNLKERKRLNNPKKMTDRELRDRINRLRLEDDYRRAQGKLTSREAKDRALKYGEILATTLSNSVNNIVGLGKAACNMFASMSNTTTAFANWMSNKNTTKQKRIEANIKRYDSMVERHNKQKEKNDKQNSNKDKDKGKGKDKENHGNNQNKVYRKATRLGSQKMFYNAEVKSPSNASQNQNKKAKRHYPYYTPWGT